MAQAPLTKCSLCSERDGSSFCSECKQVLCPSCRNIHSKIPSTAKHKITDLNKAGGLLPESDFSCEIHSEQFVLCCSTCNCFICGQCVISNHKGHAYSGIAELTKEVQKTINDFISNAKQQMVEISSRKNKINEVHIPSIKKDVKDQLGDIDEIVSEIYKACDTIKASEVSRVSEFEKAERERCESYNDNLDQISKKYAATCRKFEELLKESHDITLHRQYNRNKSELQLHDLHRMPVPKRSSFPLEKFIESLLRKLHLIYPMSIVSVIRSMAVDTSLQSGTSTKSSDWNKNLLYAARDGDNEGIVEALKMNADVNWSCTDMYLDPGNEFTAYYGWNGSPLHIAAMLGHRDCVTTLIDNGARQNIFDNQGDLPVHAAVAFGEVHCMKVLLNNGASITDRSEADYTPLHVAAYSGATHCMVELISRGADVQSVAGKKANMPIHVAADCCHTRCIKILVESGSTVMERNNMDETPLHIAIRSCNNDDKDGTLYQLIALGASPQARDKNGITPYDVAVETGNSHWIMLLSGTTHPTKGIQQPTDVKQQSESDTKKGKKKAFFTLGKK